MKVLHITNNYPSEKNPIFGIFVKEQVDSLSKLGIKNHIFFINTREKGKYHYIPSIFKLFIHLTFNKYNVIHCHHAYSGLVLFLTGYMFFNKNIISYQSDPKIEGGNKIFKLLHFFSNTIIIKNGVSTFVNYKKIKVIPNGVNLDFFKPIEREKAKEFLGLDINKKYILFMDSYDKRPYKRVDRFDEIIKILVQNYKNMKIEPIKLTNTERNKIPYFLNACNLHLLTSDVEGSPNSVKESLACNVPVVCTPVGDTKSLISKVQGSFVSKSFEPSELAMLVVSALNFERINGRQVIVERKLDSDSIALSIKNIYIKIQNDRE